MQLLQLFLDDAFSCCSVLSTHPKQTKGCQGERPNTKHGQHLITHQARTSNQVGMKGTLAFLHIYNMLSWIEEVDLCPPGSA
jgi:hypothetical protein